MTPTLRNYILRNIGPSAVRLELVNRLENLCTLTGTPMSPELHRWVEDTFGLEMVRILEGYSSLTAPVISPQLQERINRIVPNNYQVENVNLMFKQLFDVSCVSLCLFTTGQIPDTSCSGFTDPTWDFNGFGLDYDACAASFGGYAVLDGNYGNCGINDGSSAITFNYIGTTAPPDLIINDPFLGTLNYPFGASACGFGCLTTGSVRWNNSPYEWMDLGFSFISANPNNWGGLIDFTLGAQSVEDILVTMLTKYQPQASVNVTDDGSGFFTITFIDLYYNPLYLTGAFGLWYNSGFSIDTCNMTPCP